MRSIYRFLGSSYIVAILLTTGCAAPKIRTDGAPSAGVDVSRYRRIAIVDFQMISGPDRGSHIIHKAMRKVLWGRDYEITGRMEMKRKLDKAGISTDFLSLSSNAQRIGTLLDVDAIIGGTISAIPLGEDEIFYSITVSINMIDVANGFNLWFGSGSCQNGTMKGCIERIVKASMKNFPYARKK